MGVPQEGPRPPTSDTGGTGDGPAARSEHMLLRLVSCLFAVLAACLVAALCMLPVVVAMDVSSAWHAQKPMLAWGVACVFVTVIFKL